VNRIWSAEYNEGGFETISLHRTRAGARQAVKDHKEKELTHKWGKDKVQWWQKWRVRSIDIITP